MDYKTPLPIISFDRVIALSREIARVFTGMDPEYNMNAREKAASLAIEARRMGHCENRFPVPRNWEGKILSYYTKEDCHQ